MNESTAVSTTTASLVLDNQTFANIMSFAEMMAESKSTVPMHLRGNRADCAAIVIQSMQWGMNPYAVAQKTHLVRGTLGYEGQLVNAVVTARAPTKDRIQYEWFGDWTKILGKMKEVTSLNKKDDSGSPIKYMVPDWNLADEKGLGIRVWATMKGETSPRELIILMTQCRTRNSTLWTEDPKQQIAYLAVKRWARLHCPDVIMGVYTEDEIAEPINMGDAIIVHENEPKKDNPKIYYTDDQFNTNLGKWTDALKKNPNGGMFIDFIESKGTLFTDQQKESLEEIAQSFVEIIVEGESHEAA